MRRAKIVCTIGPATDSRKQINALIEAGMDVARLNLSHGTHDGHAQVVGHLRSASEQMGKPIGILLDLQGPKIRVGQMAERRTIDTGEEIVLSADPTVPGAVPLAYPSLIADLQVGTRILLDDGQIELEVSELGASRVSCRVIIGGGLRTAVGVHVPGVRLSGPTFTEKDEADLAFGLAQDVDFIALSFVQSAEDVIRLKDRISTAAREVSVIAKLERSGGVEDLEAILKVADGVMVARGDLGVELPPEEVPLVQKRIISAANQAGVFVITATQMLESMTERPRPTRAETSDVANAVLDGTDAVMLSGETAVGKFPIRAVQMMSRIVQHAESESGDRPARRRRDGSVRHLSLPDAIGHAAVMAAEDIGASAIVAFTQSGSTARLISKRRPSVQIYAFTPYARVRRQLCLCWGTQPAVMTIVDQTDRMVDEVESRLLLGGSVEVGDTIAILSGSPITAQGSTNLLKLHRVTGGARR